MRRAWRIPFVAAGVAMAAGGRQHPSSDAKDSLRQELATMTAHDSWVVSHTLLAIGATLLAAGLWMAVRSRTWPVSTQRALQVVAVTMSLYVVETIFHLAAVVDSDALAHDHAAPIAFAHVGLSMLLYPLSGVTLAWLNVRLARSGSSVLKVLGGVGIAAGVLHAASVPLTIALPDTELSPVFAGAGMLLAVWSLAVGLAGVGTDRAQPEGRDVPEHAASYRRAEQALWESLGVRPTERMVALPRLGVTVRVQEVGDGEPLLYLHGGPSAGTTWAPLAAHMTGFRSIIVDRPGTGLSAALPVTADDLGPFADAFVVDLMDALELDRVKVVASSFGGFLALRAAAAAPGRIERMVQMACPAGAPGMAVPPFMRVFAVGPLRRLICSLPPNARAARSVLRQLGHGATVDAGRFSAPFIDWYLSMQRDTPTMRNDSEMISTLVTARGAMDPALQLTDDLLRRVDVPTYFYWGADDPFGGADVARRITATMPDAQLEMVADAGHLPWLDDPARAAATSASFLGAAVVPPPPLATMTA